MAVRNCSCAVVTYDTISMKLSNSIFTFPCLCQPSVMSPIPFMPEKRILELVLDILQRQDTHEIFAEPVDPKEVEDYYEIIKEPMDFGTMRAKHHEGMYTNLEQFEHDVFLIPRNAMHFNSTGTIYFEQARVIYDLAKKVFHVLKTDLEYFEPEFTKTRRRSSRRPQGEAKGLNFNSSPRFTTNARCSLNGPSNVRRNIQGKPGFSLVLCARDGRRSNFVEVDRRCTYKPWLSFHNENDSIFSTIHSAPQLVSPVNQCDISYRESLMLFAKGLGPTAQMIANRKLQGCLKDAPNFQTPASNSSRQVATCQVPAAFASAHNGPRTLDTLIPNTSWDLFDPLPGCCSALKTTTDIIDLTDADDGEKAHMSDRMGDRSALGGKVVGNISVGRRLLVLVTETRFLRRKSVSFLQPKFQQVSVNECTIPSSSSLGQVRNKRRTFGRTHQAELTIQSSQLAMAINNQQYSVPSDTPDTNLALQLQL
ncbi:Bromodomain and PHD finger-containing protein 3 [Camellia lanceoleosa]|uniref:Bromodomain and PHD finger-containing protein 3 n=1 Tax=Camellia lanceoleosa TaxID=1840588 RepID=A0ACC0G0C0_9ERIC|nr:Bromodomain and PHD finger-containing protein 3 [Camellia lanceoleosa]